MRLDELRQIVCVGCGHRGPGLRQLPTAMSPNLRACDACWQRYGPEALAREADQVLAAATPAQWGRPVALGGQCAHCGQAVVADAQGQFPLWCAACEQERRALWRR